MPHRSAISRAAGAAVAGLLVALAVGSGVPRLGAAAAAMAVFALAIRGLRPAPAAAVGLVVGAVAMGQNLTFVLRGVELAGRGALTGAAALALATLLHAARFALAGALAAWLGGWLAARRPRWNVGPGLALAPAWVTAELLDPAPLPWSLGAASLEVPWLATPAALGVPALAALVPCLLGGIAVDLAVRARRGALAGALALAAIALHGARASQREAPREQGATLRVAAVHGVRTRATADAPPTAERAAAERAVADGAVLVVLPESTVSIDPPAALEEAAGATFSDLGAAVAIGAISRRGERNVVVVLRTDGGLAGTRAKRHPFPGGEDAGWPWAWLGTPAGSVPPAEDTSAITLTVQGVSVRVATAVCWDDLFATEADADLLLVAANDGWFEGTAAGEAHLLQARLRAVASGRPTIRATNLGATTIIDPQGRILARATEHRPYAIATITLRQ